MNKLITLADAKDAVQQMIDESANKLKLQYPDLPRLSQELETLHRVLNHFGRDFNFEDRTPIND